MCNAGLFRGANSEWKSWTIDRLALEKKEEEEKPPSRISATFAPKRPLDSVHKVKLYIHATCAADRITASHAARVSISILSWSDGVINWIRYCVLRGKYL